MDLELISFKLCPYVQRSVITLLHKSQPFKITHIDLHNPPDWFKELSPSGQVPVLKVGGSDVLFESAVINEYIDDITPPRLHPDDPLKRARHRAWIEFGSSCMRDILSIIEAQTETAFEETRLALMRKLERIEPELGAGRLFAGDDLCLVDAAWAPLFMRLDILGETRNLFEGASLDKVCRWSEALLALEQVQKSVVPELRELYHGMIENRGGEYARLALLPES